MKRLHKPKRKKVCKTATAIIQELCDQFSNEKSCWANDKSVSADGAG